MISAQYDTTREMHIKIALELQGENNECGILKCHVCFQKICRPVIMRIFAVIYHQCNQIKTTLMMLFRQICFLLIKIVKEN